MEEAKLTGSSSAAENEERHVAEVRQNYEGQISALNEQIAIMQQEMLKQEEKTTKVKEEMEVEVKLNREKEERLASRVESLSRELNDANERTRAVQKEKEEKEATIEELNHRVESALAASRVVQEQQIEKEKVEMDLVRDE